MSSLSVSWQRILTQELSLRITMKSSCHFLISNLGLPTLQNSTQFSNSNSPVYSSKVKVKVTLRLAVYRQIVCLGIKHLETHGQRLLPQLNSCGNSPHVTSSLTRRWRPLMYACPFSKYTFRAYSMLLKISCFCTTRKSSVSRGFAQKIMPILRIFCYDSLVIWTVVSLTTAKFKPLIFFWSSYKQTLVL
jgi:hypothetical protein